MTSLTIKIQNQEQERILLAFLDSLNYEYEGTNEQDTTEYLLANDAMKQHLTKSINEANEGKVKAIDIDNLWK